MSFRTILGLSFPTRPFRPWLFAAALRFIVAATRQPTPQGIARHPIKSRGTRSEHGGGSEPWYTIFHDVDFRRT